MHCAVIPIQKYNIKNYWNSLFKNLLKKKTTDFTQFVLWCYWQLIPTVNFLTEIATACLWYENLYVL